MLEEGQLALSKLLGDPPLSVPPQGLAPRGLEPPEKGVPFGFEVLERPLVWFPGVERLYEQAKVGQWNATFDVPWEKGKGVPEALERALCQILTWMIHQEFAAWYLPAKFLPRIHPNYLEPVLFLSTQIVDEARHVEAFVKRVFLNGIGFVGAYPQTESSLLGLLHQEDFDKASFLLHVLGEGTFLDLFGFLKKWAPDEASRCLFSHAMEDESRHVAYGIGRLRARLAADPACGERFVEALEERMAFAQEVSGLPTEIQQALAILAGGGEKGVALGKGMDRTFQFQAQLQASRIARLTSAGLPQPLAERINQLHVQASGNAM
ncbi:conserved hypothetical protein [Candidatus Methylacidithermus pantelleriae]|uniref:Ferritin-like domain-containing protein n=2 Tax=Candidatus Methylacidithermus pantelleriae TaxID=2744239 RepID=A0A8J2BVQ9_9BACT|nr:conserved hypothetical protein [Candidatus Methylacidithermus pantelleriae]